MLNIFSLICTQTELFYTCVIRFLSSSYALFYFINKSKLKSNHVVTHGSCFLHSESGQWQAVRAGADAPANVLRYYNFLCSQKPFKDIAAKFPAAAAKEVKGRGAEPKVIILFNFLFHLYQ